MTTPTCKQLGITLSEETNNTLMCVQWNEDVYMHWSQNHACTEVAVCSHAPSTHAEMYWSAGTLLLTLTTASAASIFNVSSLESSVILIALVMSRSSNYTGRKYFIPCLVLTCHFCCVCSIFVCVYSSISVYVRAFSILYVVCVCMFRAVTLDLIRSLRPALGGVRDSSFLSPLQLWASWGSDGL